jgi:asparagine synthase (glutamine-hydrolysing)
MLFKVTAELAPRWRFVPSDHKIVEFMAALPHTVKLRGWQKKYLLKRAMAGRLPDRILRGKKKGFNVPIPSWIRGDLREIVHDTLAPQRLYESGLWDAPFVARMIQARIVAVTGAATSGVAHFSAVA